MRFLAYSVIKPEFKDMYLDKDLLKTRALHYHEFPRPGKLSVYVTKPTNSQDDLSLAYSPGVAMPVRAIVESPEASFRYTAKGNLVGVISNGSAVLGLGDVGALASKPVMEGKAVLFKQFADIDVFDIEVDAYNPKNFIEVVKSIAPTFGGINLEDIKAPECFEIERRLVKELDIPVMHDDQHGTAIISGAALLNGLEITDKKIGQIKVVVSGAGASALSCAEHYIRLGVRKENILLCDSGGIITKKRKDAGELNRYKAKYARDIPDGGLAEALVGADVFLGLSKAGIVSGSMVEKMAARPLIFALANPTPEIMPEEVAAVRDDAIMATGRSDYPNQINNVLGFPYIFRGALDVQADEITEGMKMAATMALANLAKEPVPDDVAAAYGGAQIQFGPDYLIPKPFDARVLIWEASAVAEAAVAEGMVSTEVANSFDVETYRNQLEARLGLTRSIMRGVIEKAGRLRQRIVFTEGDHPTMLKAAAHCIQEGICFPILLGRSHEIAAAKEALGLDFECDEIDPREDPRRRTVYTEALQKKRGRKGVTLTDAKRMLKSRVWFGAMMVELGDADGIIGGISRDYPEFLKPCLATIGMAEDAHRVVGTYMMTIKGQLMFIGDATINIYPDVRTLAEIAVQTARVARRFGIEPRVALLSFSNFGSSSQYRSERIEDSIEVARELDPSLIIDGPMQADTALMPSIQDQYPFMTLGGPANVLICPNLAAANISYKLLQRLGDAEMTGPILEGMAKPVHVLQREDGVRDVVHMAAICALDAQRQNRQRL